MAFDPFLLIVAAAVGLFIFMQFRTAKKRRQETATLQEKMLPGAEIMTNYGLFGTLVSVDEDTNEALIETTPGTVLRIHRQTILKVVEDEANEPESDVEPAGDTEAGGQPVVDDSTPEFGERLDDVSKPAPKSAKKKSE